MKVLLIGGGGREHALAWAIAASPLLTRLWIAPGNPGTSALGTNLAVDPADHPGILGFCRENSIDLVVIGPEAPLVAGLSNELVSAGFAVFGPSQAAAELEGSKDFTKAVAVAAGAPTAGYRTVNSLAEARAYLASKGAPIVVKYDGLMAGKGVTVATSLAEADEALAQLYANETTAKVVLEDLLVGEEVSFFCLVDGEFVLPFGSAQDHKRAFDGDLGPNTGGMGAYSPAPVMTKAMERRALDEIVIPTAKEMVKRGTPYRGILFGGLMIEADGPKLIEYNCRFGDPECQVLMLRLKDDLLTILDGVARGQLRHMSVRLHEKCALGVVMATKGYPGAYSKGSVISGLEAVAKLPETVVFHAGTMEKNGEILANGGRVLTICALADSLADAQAQAYRAVDSIDWPDGFCRRDIGARGLAYKGTQK